MCLGCSFALGLIAVYIYIYIYIFCCGSTAKLGAICLIAEVFKPNTIRHTRWDSSERGISSSQRPLPAQHTTNTRDEHPYFNRIRTRNASNQAAADLRPHGYGDLRVLVILLHFFTWSAPNWSAPSFPLHHILELSRHFWSTFRSVQYSAPFTAVIRMFHFTSFFLKFKSISPVKRFFLFSAAFAVAFLDLISCLHLLLFVTALPE